MNDNILTPLKPEWHAFTIELTHHLHIYECNEGCWNSVCDATFKISRNILENRFPMFDASATIDYFKKSQWFCDCGIFSESPTYLGEPEKISIVSR